MLPGIWVLGPRLLVARFYWNRDRYEALANAIQSGRHPELLDTDEHDLGLWVKAMRAGSLDDEQMRPRRSFSAPIDQPPRPDYLRVDAVHFLTVTHGFAGHAGFMRVFDTEAAQRLDRGHGADGWSFSRKLNAQWYLVGD
ncbi:MAG TPA: hypothetical protein VHC20_00585 [Candidatus Paceibacterota bacterium]|nr:hypothetical protein [Candidatus Paceibacterota bacterium]